MLPLLPDNEGMRDAEGRWVVRHARLGQPRKRGRARVASEGRDALVKHVIGDSVLKPAVVLSAGVHRVAGQDGCIAAAVRRQECSDC